MKNKCPGFPVGTGEKCRNKPFARGPYREEALCRKCRDEAFINLAETDPAIVLYVRWLFETPN